MLLGAVVLLLKDKMLRGMDRRGILHMMAAGVVAFVAMVVFNPFHLTNLTHTFEISISKHAERWRNVYEWHRAFEWDNPVGSAMPFLVLYILAWLVLILWIIVFLRASQAANRPVSRRLKPTVQYAWPKLDLGLVVVAALTIYLALRSRRFILIAGFVACPVLALLIQQITDRLLVTTTLRRQEKMDPALMSPAVREATLLGMTVALAVAALWYLPLERLGWLFGPVPGNPKFTQPRLVLIFPMVILAVLAFRVSVLLYAAAKGPGAAADGAPHREAFVRRLAQTATVLLCVAVLGFGAWLVGKFKSVYLDPWPLDAQHHSVFMRMTASYSFVRLIGPNDGLHVSESNLMYGSV
jgi:hypothetical protein